MRVYHILFSDENRCERSELPHTQKKNRAFGAFLPIRKHIHSRSFSVFREGAFFLPQRTEHLNL